MGLRAWFAKRQARKYLDEAAEWVAAKKAVADAQRREQGMDKLKPWLKGLGVAVSAGVITAGADWMQNGFEFSRDGLYKGLSAVVAAAFLAAAAYLKASPIVPKDAPKG